LVPAKKVTPTKASRTGLKRYDMRSAFREKSRELLLMAGNNEALMT